jgi:hypothetical protein
MPLILLTLAVVTVGVVQVPSPTGPLESSVYILDLDNNGMPLTSPALGVSFDIEADGRQVQVGWTTRDSNDAFLCLDVNGNGTIDSAAELIGTRTALPNGQKVPGIAEALLILQGLVRGPNGRLPDPLPPGAATVDAQDAVFSRLLLWTDKDHNGRSQPSELQSLTAAGIVDIRMGYVRDTGVDEGGNRVRLKGWFTLQARGVDFQRSLIVVLLAKGT